MTGTTNAGEFQSALDRVLKLHPVKDLEDQMDFLHASAKWVIEICLREFDLLKGGLPLHEVNVKNLNDCRVELLQMQSGTELHDFYIASRGLTSQWLQYPGGETLLVHSIASHIADTMLRYTEVSKNGDVNWNVAVLRDPNWLMTELKYEYRAALNSLETGQPSKIPQRIRGGTHIWRFGVDEATDDFSGFHRRGLWWPQFLQGNSWIKERLDEWLEKGYMKVDPKAPKKGEVAFLKSFLRSFSVTEPKGTESPKIAEDR
jgi:hypothetical protein